MPPALGYRKSHNGCLSCKQRRVKCDENRPCSACARHGIPCSLITSSNIKTPPPQASATTISETQATKPKGRGSGRKSSWRQLKRLKPNEASGRSASLHSATSSRDASCGGRTPSSAHDPYSYFAKFISPKISEQPSLGTESWKSDLELMHHWSTETCLTLPRAKEVKNVWQYEVPRMALEYQYLMHQILGLSAYHLAMIHTSRHQFYLLQASQHENNAIQGMRTALAEINAENCHALFAASALLVISGHAAITIQSGGPGPGIEDILDIFLLTRGVHSVLFTTESSLATGPFRELFCPPKTQRPARTADMEAVVYKLPTLQREILALEQAIDVMALVQGGIATLIESIRSAASTAEVPDMRVVTTWPTSLDSDFITLIRKGHPAAMTILAYFCVILHATEADFWRKIKCNGVQPCDFCSRAKANCTFNSAYARGRLPIIQPGSDAATRSHETPAGDMITPSKSPSVSGQQYPISPLEVARDNTGLESQQPSSSFLEPSAVGYVGTSSRNSPEPSQTDLQGHYIGPASGVSFLLRVQKRLHQAISFSQPGSIFTFGDAPLHPAEFDPSFCMMLPRDDAQRLVDRYFDFAMPTYRFLHRPTIQQWFQEFYDTLGIMRDAHSAPAKVALLFMVFAHGRVYMPDNDRPGPSDLSTRYYLAAEHQLTKERGSVRLTSVQSRLTQCYYLLTQSRINHCWSLFGTVSHLALAIGLNRDPRPDTTSGISQIETECRRRTFWCAYTLDTYLSVALGRPRSFHDEDIDTALPACVDDHELPVVDEFVTSGINRGPSVMLASLAHIKLAQIITKILRELYSIRPIPASRRAVLTERISARLGDWRAELARFLDADAFSTSLLMPIFQRQRNVLNLTYWHAIILTHRPLLLSNFARLSNKDRNTSSEDPQTEESVQQCLEAAMNTVNTIDDITQSHQMFRAFWTTAYFAFTATIVLYIYVIHRRESRPELYNRYLSAATRCQSHLSSIAEKGSLPERYSLVLEELRGEALRQTKHMQPAVAEVERSSTLAQESDFQTTSLTMDAGSSTDTNYAYLMGEAGIDFNGMPDPLSPDYSGWGQFASLVASGLGNLDAFLDDSLKF